MSLLQISQDAIDFARQCVPLKSDNKRYAQGHAKRPAQGQILERDFALLNLRKSYPVVGSTTLEVIHYGRLVMNSKVGNCMEQCSSAALDLSWKFRDGSHKFRLIYFGPPGDHIFIVLDQPFGSYPKDFAQWDAGAVICDPWAKIACPARDYPLRWKTKMDKWDTADKSVAVAGMGWGSSLRPSVYHAPEICEKKPYTSD